MIEIPHALQAKLDAGLTTLAWAWVLTRRDGRRFGFTDHDHPLPLAGLVCAPDSGFAAGDLRQETGAAPARGAVFGTLTSDHIDDAGLRAGLWDGARLAVYRVDWTAPDLNYQVFTGELGALRQGADGFEAELSGLSARLNRTIGRVYSRRCDAELGDARCTVDLDAPGYRVTAQLISEIQPGMVLIDLQASPERFENGVAHWSDPDIVPPKARIRACRSDARGMVLELDSAPVGALPAQAQLSVTPGCDKRFETCRTRFSNAVNFQGCPHMPGNDVLVRPVRASSSSVRSPR